MYRTLKRLASYPSGSMVQQKAGYVRVKVGDTWVTRGRLVMARFLKRELLPNEKVYHIHGVPDDDHPEQLVVIKFSGTRYRLARSRPIFIPPSGGKETKGAVDKAKARSVG